MLEPIDGEDYSNPNDEESAEEVESYGVSHSNKLYIIMIQIIHRVLSRKKNKLSLNF